MRHIKKGVFGLTLGALLLLTTIAVLELVSPVVLYFLNNRWIPRSLIKRELDNPPLEASIIGKVSPPYNWMASHVLHPYLGFVRNYDIKSHVFHGNLVKIPVNEYGFFGKAPTKHKATNKITIAIMGGSVACDLYLKSRDTLRDELKKSAFFANKEIEIISIALGGMKQPQQLMALNYFRILGYHFDIIVNIDGFNEVALPFSDNIPAGINPYFTRMWHIYATRRVNSDMMIVAGKIYTSRINLQKYRRIFSRSPFRHSNFCMAFWYCISKKSYAYQSHLEKQFRELATKSFRTAQEIGPPYTEQSQDKIFLDCARCWKASSIEMWKLCESSKSAYFHFLQPNQYVEGSKTFSDWERDYTITKPDEDNPYKLAVQKGYPHLISFGEELKNMGVLFVSLVDIFQNEQASVYNDPYCHLNRLGNDLLAMEIAKVIIDQFVANQNLSQNPRF